MKNINNLARQKGVALVVGLLLLLVSSFVALAAFQSGKFQERMASNQYNKAISFMAAEQGATNFLESLADFVAADWDNSEQQFAAVGGNGFYRVQITDPAANPLNVFVTGVSRRSAAEEDLAESTLNILVEVVGAPVGGSSAAINLIGPLGSFEVPNSNSLQVIGAEGGPAVGALVKEDRDAIEQALIDKKRIGNYEGGIAQDDFDGIWRDPALLENFVGAICAAPGSRCQNSVPDGTVWNKNKPEAPKLTVIEGDAEVEFKGNDTGAGILVVAGNLTTKGTPSWDGIIIVLGSTFNIKGGGNGGVNGSLHILDVDTRTSGNWGFPSDENVNFKSSGGGTALFKHDCDKVEESIGLVSSDPAEIDDWLSSFGCGGTVGAGPPGPNSYVVYRYIEVLPVQN